MGDYLGGPLGEGEVKERILRDEEDESTLHMYILYA
jgi:hypothetical protein